LTLKPFNNSDYCDSLFCIKRQVKRLWI